jgi:hypothetical protein
MASGGIAMRKLNEMAAALSFSPTCCICFAKKLTTSNTGSPSKPGRDIAFDFRITYATGADVRKILSSLIKG